MQTRMRSQNSKISLSISDEVVEFNDRSRFSLLTALRSSSFSFSHLAHPPSLSQMHTSNTASLEAAAARQEQMLLLLKTMADSEGSMVLPRYVCGAGGARERERELRDEGYPL
jgi:hypothetical protein